MTSEIKYSDDDDMTIKGQKYFLCSFTSSAFKVRGAFGIDDESKEEEEIVSKTKELVAKLRERDEYYHLYRCKVGEWTIMNPDPKKSANPSYYESHIEKTLKEYHEERKKEKEEEKQRRLDLKKKAIMEGDLSSKDENIESVKSEDEKRKQLRDEIIKDKKEVKKQETTSNKNMVCDDDVVIKHQKYFLCSIVNGENYSIFKERGMFEEEEEAEAYAKSLREIDSNYHIFVGETGKWYASKPDTENCKKQEYFEPQLQSLVNGYNDNQEKARIYEEQQKRALKNKILNNQPPQNKNQEKRDERKNKLRETVLRKQRENESKEDISKLVKDTLDDSSTKEKVKEKAKDQSEVELDENIEKIRKLYSKK